MIIKAITVFGAAFKDDEASVHYPGEFLEVPDSVGKMLVEKKAAVEVKNKPVATAPVPADDEDPNGTIPSGEGGGNAPGDGGNEKDDLTDDEDIPAFSIDMKADELRAAMRERGLTIRVGMTKAEMVEVLNGAGDDLPDITPQDVVEE